jgi:threonine dehydrogenase-like Zn-dependent dehydrogenase
MLFWDGTAEPATTEDVTIGHENTGVVVDIGKGTEGFKVGDKVGCLGCSYACCESSNVAMVRGFRAEDVPQILVRHAKSTTCFVKLEQEECTASVQLAISPTILFQIIGMPWCFLMKLT